MHLICGRKPRRWWGRRNGNEEKWKTVAAAKGQIEKESGKQNRKRKRERKRVGKILE